MKSYKEVEKNIFDYLNTELQKIEIEIIIQQRRCLNEQHKLQKLIKKKEKLELSKLQHILK